MGRQPNHEIEADRVLARVLLNQGEFLGQPRYPQGKRAFSVKVIIPKRGLVTVATIIIENGKAQRIEPKPRTKK